MSSKTGFSIRFDHKAILVRDLGESARFYQNVLSLEEIENKTSLPNIRWFSMGVSEIHLIEDKGHKVPDVKGVHFAFRVTDLDAFMQHLRNLKVPFGSWLGESNTTNTRPDNIRQLYFIDPNGYWIEVNGD